MAYMFNIASSFNQDISSWDVSNVTTMFSMFAFSFNLSEENQCAIQESFSINPNWPYQWECAGCTDTFAINYNELANTDDGSCVSWEELANNLQSELDNVVVEDGIGQANVDAAFADGVASVEVQECEEVATQNRPLDLPQGWSLFGYTCLESLNIDDAFYEISTNIVIVKDELGLAYLPEFGFSALESLEFGEGYQIKMIEEIIDFQFCTTIVGGASQEQLDDAFDEGAASVTPEDGISQADLDAQADLSYGYGYGDGANSVDITSDNQDAFDEGAASVTPEDGITQADVDAIQQQLNTANQTIYELSEGGMNYPPEFYMYYWDAVNQCLNGDAYYCTQASQMLFDYNTPDIPYEISGCVNVTQMGYDQYYAENYECPNALNYPELLSSFFGEIANCENDTDDDGICDVNEISGCQDENAFNYNILATDDSGDCIAVLYGCLDPFACNFSSEGNIDDGSCTYPILDGDNWLNCDLQIGVAYEGGIVFFIDESGEHGLVADFEDIQDGYSTDVWSISDYVSESTSQGYDDWFLPSVSQFQLIYNTIGPGGDNSANLSLSNPGEYWTSTWVANTYSTGSQVYSFSVYNNQTSLNTGGGLAWLLQGGGYLGRPIRAF
jgi:surface protein